MIDFLKSENIFAVLNWGNHKFSTKSKSKHTSYVFIKPLVQTVSGRGVF